MAVFLERISKASESHDLGKNSKFVEIHIKEFPFIIGRGSLLKCSSTKVSRQHAELDQKNGELVIISTHTNPTYVMVDGNEGQLSKGESMTLNNGDEFGLLIDDFWFRILVKPSQSGDQDDCDYKEDKENVHINENNKDQDAAKTEKRDRELPPWLKKIKEKKSENINKSPGKIRGNSSSPDKNLGKNSIQSSSVTEGSPLKQSGRINHAELSEPLQSVSLDDDIKTQSPKAKLSNSPNSSDSDDEHGGNVTPFNKYKKKRLNDDDSSSSTSLIDDSSRKRCSGHVEESGVNAFGFKRKTTPKGRVSPAKSPKKRKTDDYISPADSSKAGAIGKKQKAKALEEKEENVEKEEDERQESEEEEEQMMESDEERGDMASNSPGQNDSPKRDSCSYGRSCYRKNPDHKREFAHPGDPDYASPSEDVDDDDDRPECEYGLSCYRRNPKHKREFKHTRNLQPPRRAKKKAQREKNDQNDPDDDYDYDDPFLNDDSSDDYVPTDTDGDDSDFDPSQADPEDSTGRMLKESRKFLKKK